MNDLISSVLCKKYLKTGGQTIYAEYKENVRYKFLLETEDIYGENMPYTYKYIYIFSEHGGHRFHLDKTDTSKTYFLNFYDYFYDNRELRKLKLKKISQVNEK